MTDISQSNQTQSRNQPVHQIYNRAENRRIWFKYLGESALTVRGIITQQVYRFGSPGAELEVDWRDAPGISAISRLRRVAQSPSS